MNGIMYHNGLPKPVEITPTKKDLVYLDIADKIAELSKDENTHVGAVIIDKNGKVVSMGYNGCASHFGVNTGKNDTIVPHSRNPQNIALYNDYSFLGVKKAVHSVNKYPFMLHAEQNALLTSSDNSRLVEGTIYSTHYPCTSCANMIAQAGIKHIKVMDRRHGTFQETIVPTLFIYENMNITLSVFKEPPQKLDIKA